MTEEQKPIFASIEEAEKFMISKFGESESFDIGMKHLHLYKMPVFSIYINGLIDSANFTEILVNIQPTQEVEGYTPETEPEFFQFCFPYFAWEPMTNQEQLLTAILGGQVAFITPSGYAFIADLRAYPGRQPEEPDNEKVIRGSRDGFTENIVQNSGLIRRRIRDASLRFELHQISDKGKTDTAIVFMKGIANEDHLNYIRQRMKKIHHDGLTMADKSIEEWLFKQGFHPLPFVRYTERPDITAAHLLEGHIAIIVDTSPSIILVPVTFFHHLQHAEEYRQAPFIGTAVRFLRFFGTFLSLIVLPFWYLLIKHHELIPTFLDFVGIDKKSAIPILLQILIADAGIEYLRLASIHTPTPLSTAMGLIAGVIIGNIAIDVGLFSPEVVLYTAITAIFTFVIPSYELSITIKVFRIFLLLITAWLGVNGFFLGILGLFLYICSLRPMKVPYMWPVVPFFPQAFLRIFIRFPMTSDALRPYIVGAKQRKRS